MLSFAKFLNEVNAEATVLGLLRIAERPASPHEGEVALQKAKLLADKNGLDLDALRQQVKDNPVDKSSASTEYDPKKNEGAAAVFAMWDASIKDADDHHHGFKFDHDARQGSDPYKVYKSSHYPRFELRIFLYHFELWREHQEIAAGVGAGRFGPFRLVLIMMDTIKRITDWVDQVRDMTQKAGYVVFKEPTGTNGYQTWLHHKKNPHFIVRIYGYTTEKIDHDRGTAVFFDEHSKIPYFIKVKEENPKSIKLLAAALKANKPK